MQDVEQLYTEYARQVYKYLFSLCHDEPIAEELMQETFCVP
jgi:RNA polymerase sigma-70 factor (ECF subfamily)